MEWLKFIAIILGAYLLGSIPSSVWAGKLFFGIDVRKHGSGNAGATNTYRVLGPKVAIPVFLLDVLKGFLAVRLIYLIDPQYPSGEYSIYHVFILGVFAMVGHIFPILAGFKGGKGVATLCGVVLALNPLTTLLVLLVFTLVFLMSGYVSMSSMLAGISYPIILMLFFPKSPVQMIVFTAVLAVLIIFTHRKNVVRLIKREENRFYFRRKRQ